MQATHPTTLSAARSARQLRVASELRESLALLLQQGAVELRGAGHIFFTFTEVTVSPDLRHADALFTAFGGSATLAEIALRESARELSFLAARRIGLRLVPKLRFIYDKRPTYTHQIEYLLKDPHVARDLHNEDTHNEDLDSGGLSETPPARDADAS